ncbi:MAG: glycosyltransferase family 2 protein [Nanoarchaeota archaeon]
MTKLIILIPCFNEEKTLPLVLAQIPKKISGISKIEILVINDGSTDRTAYVARSNGCLVVNNLKNIGLAKTFKKGIEHALSLNADILVNIDADNQYKAKDIPRLIQPVVKKQADIVIGNRNIKKIKHFSLTKKIFQFIGSWTVRFLSKTNVSDTVSGFRAYSKEALLNLNITSKFSYVLDTIIQANQKGLKIKNIQIEINSPTRKSRLSKGIFDHVKKSTADLLRVYITYEPLKFFIYLSLIPFLISLILILRYLFLFLNSSGEGHIQSLIAATILFIVFIHFFSLGIIAELNSKNRQLIEDQIQITKKIKYKQYENE